MSVTTKQVKPKTNSQIIKQFLSGVRSGEVNNLTIHNRVDSIALINYNTILLEYEFHTKTLHLNKTRYSPTTSRIQGKIRSAIPYAEVKIDKIEEYDN